ncbi:GtrA family protein [Methylobacterium sp. C33D]|uniref:GtrA family protein n=1 Tax=Methylobacterium mesophilicum TaxID=39956 RepID=UPI002F2C957C
MRRLDHLDRRVRFLFAGGFAAGVSWLARFLFSTVMPYAAAVAAATATGMVIGFIAYRSLVFPDSRRPLLAQLCGFLVVNLIGGAVTVAVATFTCDQILSPLGLGAAAPASHAIGIAAGAVANYLGHKSITFRTA